MLTTANSFLVVKLHPNTAFRSQPQTMNYYYFRGEKTQISPLAQSHIEAPVLWCNYKALLSSMTHRRLDAVQVCYTVNKWWWLNRVNMPAASWSPLVYFCISCKALLSHSHTLIQISSHQKAKAWYWMLQRWSFMMPRKMASPASFQMAHLVLTEAIWECSWHNMISQTLLLFGKLVFLDSSVQNLTQATSFINWPHYMI